MDTGFWRGVILFIVNI